MENQNKSLIWKIAVPFTALAMATFFVLNTAGFNNVLKLFGIRASDNDLINITSYTDFLGTNQDAAWLVKSTRPIMNGAVIVDSYFTLPNDPETPGMIIPTYSSRNEEENIYKTHTYISPVIDLKKTTPYINSLAMKYFETEGTAVNLSYRMDASFEQIALKSFIPAELSANSSLDNLLDRTALLSQDGERYFQFQIEFTGITYQNRAAVYEVRIDTKRQTADMQFAQMPETTDPIDRNFKFLPAAGDKPEAVDVLVLSAANQGKVPVHAIYNQPLTSLKEAGMNVSLPMDAYALVIKASGYDTQVIPLDLKGEISLELELQTFEKVSSREDFDLNGDGAINSIDLQVLLGKFGPVSP